MRSGFKFIGIYLMMIVFLSGFAPFHQDEADASETSPLSLSVTAGYDGLFRENLWFPLLIEASNDGPDRIGQLVVRPETSGNAFSNTFTTPLDLPTGSRKTVFLYVLAEVFATEVRVEFISDSGEVLTANTTPLRAVRSNDQLNIIVTTTSGPIPNLSQVASGGFNGTQSIWRAENIPDSFESLKAVDRIVFHDIDTGSLSLSQQQALRHWVLQGGHLIVTGGSNWQAINAGLQSLLPITANNSETLENFRNLAQYVGDYETALDQATSVTTGVLHPDARVIVQTDSSIPLVARRSIGNGTVDYVTFNPTIPAFSGWDGMPKIWHQLASSTSPRPAWNTLSNNPTTLAMATEIIPGYDLLPDGLNMLLFLTVYILMIGPLNYYILNRLNRRELAWVTIPLFILAFSGMAWFSGFNLRGNEVIINRLGLIQSWVDEDDAILNGALGVLSPRRNNYSFSLQDGAYMNSISVNTQSGFLGSGSNIALSQDIDFSVNDFSIDASFIATFNVQNTVPKPAISGQANVFYDADKGAWFVRGSVRNDTDITLKDVVILARGTALTLNEELKPGDLQSFNVQLLDAPASASPLERSSITNNWYSAYFNYNMVQRSTIIDMLNVPNTYYSGYINQPNYDQELQQKHLFLNGLLHDAYSADGRGDHVYLAGWGNTAPYALDFEGSNWQARDLSLYMVQLDVTHEVAEGPVTIDPSQFTWVALERSAQSSYNGPTQTHFIAQDSMSLRFIPLENAILNQVDEMHVILNVSTTMRKPLLEIWNYQTEQWDELKPPTESENLFSYRVPNPQSYLGYQNSVDIRMTNELNIGIDVIRLSIQQRGDF